MNYLKKSNNINLGIQILRSLLCFWVICFHCLNDKKINYITFYIAKKKLYHVPCFIFISFYFSYNIFSQRLINKFKNRIERLLIPYIIWPIIIMIFDNIMIDKSFSFYNYMIHLILGVKISVPFWYLFSVIFFSVFIFIISLIYKQNFLFIIQLSAVIILIIQYSYISRISNFLNQIYGLNKFAIMHSIGIFPSFALALSCASSKIVDFLIERKLKYIFFSYIYNKILIIIGIFCLFKLDIFNNLIGYNGLEHIFASLLFFIGFYLLPIENIPSRFKALIINITNCTNGIYCLHVKVNFIIKKKFYLSGNLNTCIIIYLVCYFISFCGIKIFKKTKIK